MGAVSTRSSVRAVLVSVGLMALLLALGPMSIAWMSAIALVVLAQKLARPCPLVDVTLALALIAFGAATI